MRKRTVFYPARCRVNNLLTSLNNAVTSLSDAVTSLNNAVTSLNDAVTTLNNAVTSLSDAVTSPSCGEIDIMEYYRINADARRRGFPLAV